MKEMLLHRGVYFFLCSLAITGLFFLSGCQTSTVQPTLAPTQRNVLNSPPRAEAAGAAPLPGLLREDPTRAPTRTAPIPTGTPVTIPTSAPLPTRTPAPVQHVTGWGPWGLIASEEGLWAMRGDGSTPILLTNDPIVQLSVSPNGRMAAYITHPDPRNYLYGQPFGYMLKLLSIYTGELVTVASLDVKDISGSSPEAFGSAILALEALNRGGLAWSPGSTYLAFTSAQDGLSGDIYIYVTTTGELRRITQLELPGGPAYAHQFSFSPTGWSLFYSAAYNFGFDNQEGDWLAGSWVTDMRGQQSYQVAGEDSAGENVVAWLNNNEVILSSRDLDCESLNLRIFNIPRAQERPLWTGCYAQSLYDRRRGEFLVSVPEESALFNPEQQPGLWLVHTWQNDPILISQQSFDRIYQGDQSAKWYGYRLLDGLSAIDRDGTITPLFTGAPFDITSPIAIRPMYHVPNDPVWYWSGDGLYAARPGEEAVEIYPISPDGFWPSPTERGLFFFYIYEGETARFYAFRAGDWEPLLVSENIASPSKIDWTD